MSLGSSSSWESLSHSSKGIKAARLADQIRDYLATWTHQDFPQSFLSITQVTLEPDYSRATAWVELLNPTDKTAFQKLIKRQGEYQAKLYRALGKISCPRLVFKLDDRPDLNQRFDELLKS